MHHHAHPDPEVASVVEHCVAHLAKTHAHMADQLRLAATGQAPMASPDQAPVDPRRLCAIVTRLCDEGEFELALAPALVLNTQAPDHPAFAMLAATCLQRTGRPAAALALFGMAGLHGGAAYAPAATFRSGECLSAMGKTREAVLVFDAVIEASRQNPDLAELQRLAQAKADALRAG
jgi:tetratricopeptide (TPR) repeat protein